ncbi:Detected protein of unknown function [Hibiscus syriacus]|uniref:TF-B3 domain-containing protein n=1 Tax=Hibiscus syriacus TaxID=106335 RepID=A0A6A3AK38_HIBSY|nr:Detected protein of unknown function [Hibiscus syriacus]
MELIFSKLLTQTDIERRLSVPTRILYFLPFMDGRRYADLRVKDVGGHLWTFRCIWRDGEYAKPVFSKGWLEFVYAKNLRMYDKVELYVEKDVDEADVAYRIVVRRNVLRLMGRDIWIDLQHLHLYYVQ